MSVILLIHHTKDQVTAAFLIFILRKSSSPLVGIFELLQDGKNLFEKLYVYVFRNLDTIKIIFNIDQYLPHWHHWR